MTALPLPAPPPTTARALAAAGLADLWEKVRAGERLSADDGLRLFEHPNLPLVGWMANRVREHLHGDRCWFNRNLHINATNVCEASCIFCSFARLETGDPAAWTMTMEQALSRIRVLADELVTEVHIVNGLNPDLPFDYYTTLMERIKAERPELHVKGFTAVELHYYSEKYGLSTEQVLASFRAAGLGSMPGGGAEIFADRARRKLCHDKVDSAGWLDIHRRAHRMGFRTNATMLFGSIETLEERVDHLLRLREMQDRSLEDAETDDAHAGGRFVTFIPLRFHNDNNRLARLASPTGFDSLRTIAVSRLLLDNFAHVKAYWPMLGTDEAQVALHFGASDLDGTVREEHIYHMAGADTPQGLNRSELVRFIEHAGRIPAERDTLYNVIRRCDPPTRTDDAETVETGASIGWVGYSNARPLVAGLDGVTLRGGHPSEVARWLADGEVGLALLPVGALLSEPAGADWRVVPDVCIGCEGAVDSVLLAAETPPEQWTRVLLDGVSRTSVLLARLLLEHGPLKDRVRDDLELVEVAPGAGVESAVGTVATVVIGDAALQRPARLCHTVDLGAAWHDWTGLPFVFAVWAGHPDLDPAVAERVRSAGVRGLQGLADGTLLADASDAERAYLTRRIRYPLDDRATMGLLRFAALAKRHGLVQRDTFSLYDPPLRRPRPAADRVADLLERAVAGAALPAPDLALLLDAAPLVDLLAAADLRREALHPGAARTYTTEAEAPRTLAFGAGESSLDLARLLVSLRDLPDVRAVAVQPTPEAGTLVGRANNTAVRGLRLLAVARLALPDTPHVQASWRAHGRGLAQLAQHGGADDFGAVLPADGAAAMVDGVWPMTTREAERNLRLAGLQPQRRDARWAPVEGATVAPERAGRPLRRLVPPTPGK